MRWPARMVKRMIDILIAVSLLILLAPIWITAALLVMAKLGPPILFSQQRPGRRARPFTIYKFRTMTNARNAAGELLPDAQRLTPVGRLLRRTTIDELPELWNVVRGDMSLVGPRPLLMSYLSRYTPEQARRHEVRPGLTGYAVVNGRNSISWEEKLRLDVWYVDHQSLWLDLQIMFKTVQLVFAAKGVSADGHATMPEFTGSAVEK